MRSSRSRDSASPTWAPTSSRSSRPAAPPGAVDRPAPLLGEHTVEILAELGYDDAERTRLREAGIVSTGME